MRTDLELNKLVLVNAQIGPDVSKKEENVLVWFLSPPPTVTDVGAHAQEALAVD